MCSQTALKLSQCTFHLGLLQWQRKGDFHHISLRRIQIHIPKTEREYFNILPQLYSTGDLECYHLEQKLNGKEGITEV